MGDSNNFGFTPGFNRSAYTYIVLTAMMILPPVFFNMTGLQVGALDTVIAVAMSALGLRNLYISPTGEKIASEDKVVTNNKNQS